MNLFNQNQTRRSSILFVFSFSVLSLSAQLPGGPELVKKMHARYFKAPCACYTFSQNNKIYRNDSLVGLSQWYETVCFPDRFLVMRDRQKGNWSLNRNDSIYVYRDGKLFKSRSDSSALLLLLGGMYYRELQDVMQRLKAAQININVISEQSFNGQETWVIGAQTGDLRSSQLWVDKKELKVLRIILSGPPLMDFKFLRHQKMCAGYSETEVAVSVDGKLVQEESYFDLRETKHLPAEISK